MLQQKSLQYPDPRKAEIQSPAAEYKQGHFMLSHKFTYTKPLGCRGVKMHFYLVVAGSLVPQSERAEVME